MKTNYKRRKHNGIDWAILLICAGALFLLFNLGVIPAIYKSILISWQMLLIVLGISHFVKRQYPTGFILLIIGIVFIYPKLYRVFPDYFSDINIDFSTYWPLILIAIGLFMVFGKNKFRKRNKFCNKHSDDIADIESVNKAEYLDKNLMFSSSEQIVLSPNFRGGESNVMFGELKIDLRKASLHGNNAQLEINVMFGSTIIYVPSHWVIDVQNNTLFGDFRDNRSVQNAEDTTDAPQLVITGGCLFGSGEIRN